MFILRKPANRTSLTNRYRSFSNVDRMKIRRKKVFLRQLFNVFVQRTGSSSYLTNRRILLYVYNVISSIIEDSVIWVEDVPRFRRMRIPQVLNNQQNASVRIQYRFHSIEHLRRLFHGFQLPDKVTLSNGMKMNGEEVLLIALYRLHRPSKILICSKT